MFEYLDQQGLNEKLALRHKISTFGQLPSELFWQAWKRFDGYSRERPHHGYSDFELLQFFYYGVREYFQVELDAAGFWELCAEYIQGAYRVVDYMAFSSLDNPIAELEAQICYMMEASNKKKDIGFDMVEQEQINQSSFQESIHSDLEDSYCNQQTTTLPSLPAPIHTHEVSHPTSSRKLHKDIGEARCEEVMTISVKKPSIVDKLQSPPVVDEKVIRKCGDTLQNRLTKKFGDSTRYELSVKFEKTTFASSYCDSGSNLSWMTYATARSMGFSFNHFQATDLSLKFADKSEIVALGVLQDLEVTINNLHVRADFAVLALGQEFDDTLILGKPFVWVARAFTDVPEEETDLHLGDTTTTPQSETVMRANELASVGAESVDEINLQSLPERVDTVEEELGVSDSKEVTPDFVEESLSVNADQTTLVVQDEVTTLDEHTLQSQDVQEHEDVPRLEPRVKTEDMSPVETCHDSSSVETENFSPSETEDITSMGSQTRHGLCAEDIIESAEMPRTGPDKPRDHKVSQFDMIVHLDIEDSLAKTWPISKKGNEFPWDDGISRELDLVDDLRLENMNIWVNNLLEPYLIVDQNKSRFLIRDAGKTAGIPRTGPDISSFHEFDHTQFLSFAGEGGSITYCDAIGSVTRPPEILLNVPVLC